MILSNASSRRLPTWKWLRCLSWSQAIALLLLLGVSARLARAEPAPPNVVLIISDDQAWTDYGFMGHEVIRTPHLDKLARESHVFTRGYVPSSLCRPSLATLATGLYPHQHKITGNDPMMTDRSKVRARRQQMVEIFEESPTVMGLLGKKGYVSFQSGKWWEGPCLCGKFTEGMTHGDPERGGRHGDAGLSIGRRGMKPIYDFIDDAGDKPFFIWYAPFLPHTPHNPPERLLKKYRTEDGSRPLALAKYYAMCEWFDETCGDLLGFIDKRGLRDNTLVVYVTDNGWIQKTRKSVLPSGWRFPHAPRSKRSPYDGGLRTPVMLRWPGKIAPARDDVTLVSSVDLAPTILAACGVEKSAAMPGIDLRDAEALGARDTIYGAVFTHNAVSLDRPAANLMYRWCIRGRWKLILPHFRNVPDRQAELYDVVADPHETKDHLPGRPDLGLELSQKLAQWWAVR